MRLSVLLAVGLLGGAGAVTRVLISGAVSQKMPSAVGAGTLAVNLLGSFGLGLLVGAAVTGEAYRLAAVAFIGALTTFSTWMLETDRLVRDGRLGAGAANIVASLMLGLGVAWAGRELGSAL